MKTNFPKISSFVIALSFMIANQALAVDFKVLGRNGETLWTSHAPKGQHANVGTFTLAELERAQARKLVESFQADESGVLSIGFLTNDTEVVSITEVRAWGWCFSIDGVVPSDTMPNETALPSDTSAIVWFYGFALYKDGNWISMCVPGATVPRIR